MPYRHDDPSPRIIRPAAPGGGAKAAPFTFALVRVASTANLTLSGAQTIDGIACVAGDLVLAKNQTTAADRKVYTVASAAWSAYKIPQPDVVCVKTGTANIRLTFFLTAANTFSAARSAYG